jgi:serine/threonine-protein kinase
VLRLEGEGLGIVQEFISGADLFDDQFKGLGLDSFLRIIWQISAGIRDIHAAGVIHRDIKPNNMKIDSEGILKIYDFGLARDSGPTAMTRGFVGTQGFGAPELFASEPTFTEAVDVYAFGATALYIASGDLPDELCSVPPSYLGSSYFSSLPLGLDPNLSAVLDACLSPNAMDRPSMDEVTAVLMRYMLRDKHQALAVYGRTPRYLNANNRSVNLDLKGVGSIGIKYTGLDFVVASASGEVSINNRPPCIGESLPGSCVVSLGDGNRRATERAFITFDVSHPEIVL